MATNAERQQKYRKQAFEKGDGKRRLEVWIETGTKCNLERLAAAYGLKEKAILETIINERYQALSDSLDYEDQEKLIDKSYRVTK